MGINRKKKPLFHGDQEENYHTQEKNLKSWVALYMNPFQETCNLVK